ncbi:hypothetical protein [Pediococcus acidilactici]|uniref:hypothetical protein n=1 Tax=Pediococcus acidilactici TaxID=1254 RepID=UPI001362887E|nr:hypothetical protein [Pediococcus acidilactici]QHM53337.1 hypothetical protein C7M42_00028 [Pediococcus acidilactici]
MKERFDKWTGYITPVVSIISIVISLWTAVQQMNFKNEYSDNATQVMINSAADELSSLDETYDFIYHMDEYKDWKNINLDEYLINLRENYKIVSQISTSNLPNKQILNYQTYRTELNSNIKNLELFNKLIDWKHIDSIQTKQDLRNLLNAIMDMRNSVKRIEGYIKKGKVLNTKMLDRNDDGFEKAYVK